MFHIRSVVVFLVVGLLLAACSQTAEAPKETEETLRLESAATSPYTDVSWHKYYGYTSLISPSQGFCYLAGVQGNLTNGADQISVFMSPWTDEYLLHGSNAQGAKAICVNWSALKINYNAFEPVRWLSDEFQSVEDCGSNYTNTWFGDAVTYLTGVGGNLAAGGGVFAIQSRQGNAPSQLLASKNCGSGDIYVRGRSMFFGRPHNNDMPQFWGPRAQGKTYSLAGYYVAQSNYQSYVEMAPTDKAFCYLTGVYGNFKDMSDSVYIFRGTNLSGKETWRLSVYDSNPVSGKFVGATAACYMLSQN